MTHHLRTHHIHFIHPAGIRSARPIAKQTPDTPPALPGLLALLAQTKHQPIKEI